MLKKITTFIALAMAIPLAGCFDYSDGQRVGTIIKFSKKGVFCKTWEGEMLLGGLKRQSSTDSAGNTNTSMVANVWRFTVEDERLVEPVQAALESGRPVTMGYRQELATFCRSESGDYFATSIH
jgi:hypothetical protein